jgi:hypothetical protein
VSLMNSPSRRLTFLTDHALRQWSARYHESMLGLKDVRYTNSHTDLLFFCLRIIACWSLAPRLLSPSESPGRFRTNLIVSRVATRLPNLMREVGFVEVESRMIQLPTCAWSSGQYTCPYGTPPSVMISSFPMPSFLRNKLSALY